jgi:hypothetical protein
VIPEPVEVERQEQWLREFREAAASAKTAASSLMEHLRHISSAKYDPPIIDEASLKAEYKRVAEKVKNAHAIRSAPFSERSLSEVFGLSVVRQPPFEKKKDVVIGFQDAVILLSVVDDIRRLGKASAFVSSDKVFEKCQPLLLANDVDLRMVPGLQSILDIFIAELKQQVQEFLRREEDEIKPALYGRKNEIEGYIAGLIPPTEFGSTLLGTVVLVNSANVTDIEAISNPFPENLLAPTLSRQDGAVVNCTGIVNATLNITVDQNAGWFAALFSKQLGPGQSLAPKLETDSISRRFEVEFEARYEKGSYTVTRVTDVRLVSSLPSLRSPEEPSR